MAKLVQQIIGYLSTIPRPRNWVLKLLSFFFALSLWYFVVGEDKVDMTVSIPVEIVNLPRDLVIANQFKRQLDVAVSGQRSLIRSIASQHTTRSIDLSKAKPGTVVIENEPDSIDLPWGISVLRIQPRTITLRLDRLIQKKLTIKPQLTGKPAPGFKLLSVTLDPPHISVSGPENALGKEEFLKTQAIDLHGLKEPCSKQVSLALTPVLAELLGEPVVTVQLDIRAALVVRQFQVPVTLGGGRKYKARPPTVTVRAELPKEIALKAKDSATLFTAVAHPQDLAAGRTALTVIVNVSDTYGKDKEKIRILDVSPKTIALEIESPKKLKIKPTQ